MMKIIAALAAVMCFVLYSCGLTGGETIPPASGIYIVNASPDAPPISVALNSTILANGFGYEKDSGYFLTAPGTYTFRISKTTSDSTISDKLLNIPAAKYYSLFFVDSFNALKILFIEDNLSSDTFTYANVRLFDFCPNSPTVRAVFANLDTTVDNDTLNFQSRSFNDQGISGGYTNFTSVPAGSYNFSIRKIDSTAALIKDFGSLNFTAGKYYTVYMKGIDSNATVPLEIGVIQH